MLEALTFNLRDRLWGRLALRKDLPKAPAPCAALEGERRFYELVLARAGYSRSSPTEVVFDVGCRNWSYAEALATSFPNATLVGVEVDGGRRYWNLHRRIDVARAYAAKLESAGRTTECLHADLREVELKPYLRGRKTVAFCFFFPFVSERPCRKWGLPPRFADFGSLLTHVRAATEGMRLQLVSCHQGQWEAELVRETYGHLGLEYRENVVKCAEFDRFWPGRHNVHVFSLSLG